MTHQQAFSFGRGGAPPTGPQAIRPVYMTAEQRKMLEPLKNRDYYEFLDVLSEAENKHQISATKCKIPPDRGDWREQAIYLLAQRPPETLASLIDMTLPQRVISDPQFANTIRSTTRAGFAKDVMNPVIYVNCVADKDGLGLTRADYGTFLDAMDAAMKTTRDPRFDRNNRGLRSGIEQKYLTVVNAQVTFFDSTKPSLRKNVAEFTHTNRTVVLPDAAQQQCDHILPKFELGWALYCYKRGDDHLKLRATSPDILRLAVLVLMHLFPTRGFHLRQFALFDVMDTDQAAIGESVGSQMCASYKTTGGFNRDQAGNDIGAQKVGAGEWKKYRSSDRAKQYLENVATNIEAMHELYKARLDEQNTILTNIETQHEYDGLQIQKTDADRELKLSTDLLRKKRAYARELVNTLNRKLDEREEAERQDQVAVKAALDFAASLKDYNDEFLPF